MGECMVCGKQWPMEGIKGISHGVCNRVNNIPSRCARIYRAWTLSHPNLTLKEYAKEWKEVA